MMLRKEREATLPITGCKYPEAGTFQYNLPDLQSKPVVINAKECRTVCHGALSAMIPLHFEAKQRPLGNASEYSIADRNIYITR